MKREREKPPVTPWRPPTRRGFVAMLGAAVAVIAVRSRAKTDDAPKPIWIGHC